MVSCETPLCRLWKSVSHQLRCRMSGGEPLSIQELRHHKTGRAGTDQEGVGTSLGRDLLQAVHGARGGLD